MMRTLAISVMAVAAATVWSQAITLYVPVKSIRDQGITVGNWGSGIVSETDEMAYEGTFSIRISTRNFFQGGVLSFAQPIDLSAAFADKSNTLRFTLAIPDLGTTINPVSGPSGVGGPVLPGGPPMGVPGVGGGRPGGFPARPGGGGVFGGVDAGGGGGRPVGGGRPAGALATGDTPMRNLRVVITTTDGLRSEAYIPLTSSSVGDRGWRSVAVPLQGIAGFERTNKQIASIAFSGDAAAVFYVGEVRVINDTTPISGTTNVRELNLALGDQVTFVASGFGGSSILRYTWDFDDRDGIQVDAEGMQVTRRFRRPGDFTVTLTISDVFGLKQSYSTTIRVRVNP